MLMLGAHEGAYASAALFVALGRNASQNSELVRTKNANFLWRRANRADPSLPPLPTQWPDRSGPMSQRNAKLPAASALSFAIPPERRHQPWIIPRQPAGGERHGALQDKAS